jgi:histidinol phosphatase-like PHP family hydrolase
MVDHKVKLSIGSDAHELAKIGQFNKIAEVTKSFNLSEFLLTNNKENQNTFQ